MTITEVEVYEEVIDVPLLTERQAKALDKKIRAAGEKLTTNVNDLYDLLDEAANGQIHVALGFPSWTAYVKDATQFTFADRIERKELVKLMSGKGMSQRAIAGTLGVSQKTVDRDLEGESFNTETVTTLSGSTVKRNRVRDAAPEIIDAEIVEERTATDVVNDFRDEVDGLLITIQALKDLLEDDLFSGARKRINQRYGNKLKTAISDLDDVVNKVAD